MRSSEELLVRGAYRPQVGQGPKDRRQLSNLPASSQRELFQRSKGRCENCGRPHGKTVAHLGDGRWWDVEATMWRSGLGKALRDLPPLLNYQETIQYIRVFLAAVHLDRDSLAPNRRVYCQRCAMLHHQQENLRKRCSDGTFRAWK
ncbi:hypothetical protein EB232_35405 (plasmid) [Mesorhizobium sp. NZP2077]|nr:hypothetical protein EB232_35405 [Mesorhizobium sp. NZP2077]